MLCEDPAITAEQLDIIDHFIRFIGAPAQNREQQNDRSPDKENDTCRSLRLIKYTFIIQSERKKHTESHDQQIDGQSDEEDNGEVIVEGIQG